MLLYRLDSQQLLGGFRVRVESSNSLKIYGNTEASRLESDLTSRVFVAIDDGIKKHVPGALPAK